MGKSKADIEKLIALLKTVLDKLLPNTDVVWTRYNSAGELEKELTAYIDQLQQSNTSCLEKLSIHFAPTGTFQEISLSNGWGEEFLILAETFDDC